MRVSQHAQVTVARTIKEIQRDTGFLDVSLCEIAKRTGYHRRYIQAAVRQMNDDGILSRTTVLGMACLYEVKNYETGQNH